MSRTSTSTPYLLEPAAEQALLEKVHWPSHEPLAFMRRRGGIPLGYAEYYEQYHRPENVRLWAKLLGPGGMARLHFFKGMGLRYEREEIDRTIGVAKIMHQEGLKVSLYVGGTLQTDWFYKEVPEAREWACVAADGSPITYMGYQLWRHFPCINNPAYRAYIRKVLDVGLDEAGADEIFFDNQILRAEPRSCRCKVCLKLFPEFVEKKYTPEQRRERFGHPDISGITPPQWSEAWPAGALREIRDTVTQEWIDFRCHTVHDFFLAMQAHIHGKKPAVSVGMNIKGIHSHNLSFNNGIDHGRWQEAGFNCCDAGLYAHIGKRGNVLAEFRAYKITHTTGMSQSGQGGDLNTLLYAVANKQLEVPGFGRRELRPFGRLGRFIRAQEGELYGTRPILTDVGVLRSFPSMAYHCMNWCYGPFIVEQGLWEARIPFGILFDQNMENLSAYRVLVLANQEALSDRNVERLKRFVERGGGLVATENTGAYDDWRRVRVKNALWEAFGLASGGKPAAELKAQRLTFGKGRVAYLPKLVPKHPYQDDFLHHPHGMHEDAFAPANWKQVEEALRWAAGGHFRFEVKAPHGVVAEFRQGPAARDRVVHLMNYHPKPLQTAIRVALPAAKSEAWTLELRSPDPLPKKPPALKYARGAWKFSLPGIGMYTACILRPQA